MIVRRSDRPLDIWPTFSCLTGAADTAAANIEWSISGPSPCDDRPGFACEQSSSHWVTPSASSESGDYTYELAVTFNAHEEYSYEVALHVRGLSLNNASVVKDLTAVSYVYAVHPPLDDQCNLSPISDVDKQGECDQTTGKHCHCDFVAINETQCQALQCLRYYRDEAESDGAWTDLHMDRDAWTKRCENAGCLYRAAMESNKVTYVVEEGWWPSKNTVDTTLPLNDHWTPNQATGSFTLSTTVQRVHLDCPDEIEQSSLDVLGNVPNSSCADGNRTVYWRPCDNTTTMMDLVQQSSLASNIRKANWKTVWSPGALPGALPFSPGRLATCAIGRWSPDARGGCQGFEYPFTVTTPGTYMLQTTLQNLPGRSSAKLQLPAVEVIVGPGRMDLYQSSLAQQKKADPHMLPKIQGRSCASVSDQTDSCTSDELNQNPRSGPNVGGKGNKYRPSRIVYDYSLVMKDAAENRRDGTDQMLVRIKLVDKTSPRLASSTAAQGSVPQAQFVACFATGPLKKALAQSSTGTAGHLHHECGQQYQTINVGELCDETKAGEYTFRSSMGATPPAKSLYGVFQLDVWLCPLEQLEAYLLDPESGDLSGCLQELNSNPDPERQQIVPLTNADCVLSPTPTDETKNCHRVMGQPEYLGYGQSAADVDKPVRSAMPMVFTVCPPNSDTSMGRWDVPAGDDGSGFVQGPQLHTCTCKQGYMGHKGLSCEACRGGKYTNQPGSPVCSDCAVGKHYACSTGDCGPGNAFPACTECDLCQIGRYQSTPGQEDCANCVDGFNCQDLGMTYPVAYEGHYISAIDPEETTTCADGWGATRKQRDLLATSMTEDIPSYPSGPDGHQYDYNPSSTAAPHLVVAPDGDTTVEEWVQAGIDKKDRSIAPYTGARGLSCPGGNMSLARDLQCIFDTDSHTLVSSTDGGRSGQCRLAVGSLCLEGYAGENAAACQTCDQSWYHDSATGQCYPCPNTNGKVLLAAVSIIGLVMAPIILKFAEAMKHAGALQAPIMSLVNFFQSADLFKGLDLHWPPAFLTFVVSAQAICRCLKLKISSDRLLVITEIRCFCIQLHATEAAVFDEDPS